MADEEMMLFAPGGAVFREGDAGDSMYVVLEGKLELRVRGRLLETVGPGGVLGEMALIEQAPRVATATAKTDCALLPISEASFTTMIQKNPNFALQIMRVMAGRLRKMNSRLTKPAAKPVAKARPAARAKGRRRPTSRTRAARSRSSRR